MTKRKLGAALGIVTVSAICLLALGGNLEPTSPPGPTMKTLAAVEPRIAIYEADLTLTISQPGSYYLAEDCEGPGGIGIWSSNVTIDLNGYRLQHSGIFIMGTEPLQNIEIRNGNIDGSPGFGINLPAENVRVFNVRVDGSMRSGILVGNHSLVRDCFVVAAEESGIQVGNQSLVQDSQTIGGNSDGIQVGQYSRVTGCVSRDNQGTGIVVDWGGVVEHSSAISNYGDGIRVVRRSYVLNNNVYGNAPGSTDGAGIRATETDNRIEGNHLIGNDYGLTIVGSGNLIIKNSLSGNGLNYAISSGNDVGPFGPAATATSPWANIVF